MSEFLSVNSATVPIIDDERCYSLFRGEQIASNSAFIPGMSPHAFNRQNEVAAVDWSLNSTGDTQLSFVPVTAGNLFDLLQMLENPNNRGHLTDTAWKYDATRILELSSVDDIHSIVARQQDPDSFLKNYAIVAGPHYDESTGMFRSSHEVVGGLTHQVRSHAAKSHSVQLFIDRDHARRGFGLRMIKLAQWAIFQDQRASIINCYVHPDNAPANSFANRAGMRERNRLSSGVIRYCITKDEAGF